MRSWLLVFPLLLVACPKSEKNDGKDKDEKKSESPEAKKTKSGEDDKDEGEKPAPKKKADKKLAVEGVGEIPPWSADKGSAKPCTGPAAAKKKLKSLQDGDDADVTNNKADLEALEKEIAGDCRTAERQLADALNSGGFQHYKKKKYDEANRWWRAALVVRPSLTVARYNLACGLALDGKGKAAVAQIQELARATRGGDAGAANFLEKAKSDDDLASVRDDGDFKEALKSSGGNLVGPRKEPEVSAATVKLLPEEYKKGGKHPVTEQPTVYKPAVVDVWTWRPDKDTELLVGTLVHDPATLGKPKGDLNNDYGGIVVLKRNDGKLELLLAKKTGEAPPAVTGGPGNTVKYSFYEPCGDLRGVLAWKGGKVQVTQMTCEDLDKEASAKTVSKKKLPTCKDPEGLFAIDGDPDHIACAKSCGADDECGKGKTCSGQAWLVDEVTGEVYTGVGKSVPVCQ